MTDSTDTGAVTPSQQAAPAAETTAPSPKPKGGPATRSKARPAAPVAPQHLVAVKDSKKYGLTHGEVISTPAKKAAGMIKAGVAREATQSEIDLAQPRIRVLG